MKIVFAGNYQQYSNWLHKNNLTPRDAVYVDSPERILGLRFKSADIVKTGEWWLSKISPDGPEVRARMF